MHAPLAREGVLLCNVSMKRVNDVLFVGATHGDESIGVDVLQELSSEKPGLQWLVGNEYAYRQGTRRFEGDLNRSAPGKLGAASYEERRAAELIAMSRNYAAFIDLHGTDADTGIFLIVTNPTEENLALARRFSIDRVVVLPAITPDLEGPVSEYVPCGLEIECGRQNDVDIRTQLATILSTFLKELGKDVDRGDQQIVYELYGIYEGDTSDMQEFVSVAVGSESFVPLFIDCYGPGTCMQLRVRE